MIFLMARQKSGVSMLGMQRLLDIKSYKTVWLMGHKIRKAMADRDGAYQLAGIIEMDDGFVGPKKKGKKGRGSREVQDYHQVRVEVRPQVLVVCRSACREREQILPWLRRKS